MVNEVVTVIESYIYVDLNNLLLVKVNECNLLDQQIKMLNSRGFILIKINLVDGLSTLKIIKTDLLIIGIIS